MLILMKPIAEGDLGLCLTPGSTQFMYYLICLSSNVFLFLKVYFKKSLNTCINWKMEFIIQ